VLDERKRLEATVDGLQPLIKIGLTKMEEMRKTKMVIANSQAQIEANENVHFEIEVTRPKQIQIPPGRYLTNCNKCHVTCHNPCVIPNDDGKVECAAMDRSMPEGTRTCTICPNKCIWYMHSNQPYRWEYVKEKQVTSSGAIKQKYESELKKKLTAKELVEILEKDVEDNNKIVLERVEMVSKCIKRLDEIALRPNPFSTPEYIDLIITTEQREQNVGYMERIKSLKKLRQMAIITYKVRNKENLLSLDEKDDELGDGTVDHDDHYGASMHSQVDQDMFKGSFICN
jgi:Pyruvate/2-oxoacid:ferredoxin oxidoreductase delta subunit